MLNRCFITTILTCSLLSTAPHAETLPNTATHPLVNNNGTEIGTVLLTKATKGTIITVDADMLPPGAHGAHIHSVGNCTDIEHFKKSKGHIGKSAASHGFLHEDGFHQGDLPNLYASADGKAKAEFFTPYLDWDTIYDEDGASLILHAEKDDHHSQPIGGAGARIACSELKLPTTEQNQH